jgi:hypothetical protein
VPWAKPCPLYNVLVAPPIVAVSKCTASYVLIS